MNAQMYLDLDYVPRYIGSSRKRFAEGESHVTRLCTQNVLLLVTDGKLCFEENGELVSLGRGEYYIQTMGKHQTGHVPSESPEYIFINFTGRFKKRSGRGLPLRGSFDVDRIETLYSRLKSCEHSLKQTEDICDCGTALAYLS